jgi:hypothetical protein
MHSYVGLEEVYKVKYNKIIQIYHHHYHKFYHQKTQTLKQKHHQQQTVSTNKNNLNKVKKKSHKL